jgi:hypothetical protein
MASDSRTADNDIYNNVNSSSQHHFHNRSTAYHKHKHHASRTPDKHHDVHHPNPDRPPCGYY